MLIRPLVSADTEGNKDEPQELNTATSLQLEEGTLARQAQPEAADEDQNVAQNEVSVAQEVEQTSLKPADEVTTPTITAKPTTATIVITRPPKPTKKPKPVKATTVAPVS